MTRKIGILGGTFDPIHLGHLIAAEVVRDQMHLERVIFIPARQSPLKQDRLSSPIEHRLAMVRLAVDSNPRFEVSTVEIDRGIPSYTIETARYLQGELGPEAALYFLVGLDQAASLPQWKDPHLLLEMCQLVFMSRSGWPPLDLAVLERHMPSAGERVISVEAPAIGISSTDIRRRVSQGLSIRYLVPAEVEGYILSHRLYSS